MSELDIKGKTIAGIFWKFAERIGAQMVSLIVSIVLARILKPTDYSVVSVVTIFFNFANVLISGGLNTALVQKKEPDADDYSSVLFSSLFLSIVIYITLFISAPTIANIYEQEILVSIIRIMGISLPITAIKSIWCAYISSNMLFKKFFFATIVGTVTSAVVGIVMAINGAGAWALVAQQVINTLIDTLILIISTKVPLVFHFSLSKFKNLFNYGWKILVSSIIGTIYSELVPLVIGVKYTSTDLSYYTKGRSFPSLISSTTTNTLSSVLFPALSKFQNEKERLLNCTRRFVGLSSFVTFPLMLGFFAVSDTFIEVVLTEKWLPSSPYIKIFCVTCMFDMIHVGNCETIKAMGRSDIYLIMEIIKKTGYFITIAFFWYFTNSPQALTMAFLVCTIIATVVNSVPNKRLIGYKFRNQAIDLLPNLFTAGIMCICVIFVGKFEMESIWKLMIQIVVGMIVYLILNIIIKNENLVYICNLIRGRLRK